jgi:hypothetical protein
MGLFGNSDDKQRDNDALVAEVQRLDALPYEALAAEILQRVFAPGAPGAAGGVQPHEAIAAISPTDRIFGIDAEATAAITELVYEGLHLLYRAGLLTWSFSGGDHASMSWDLSRAGRRALEQGTVGVALEGCAPKVP